MKFWVINRQQLMFAAACFIFGFVFGLTAAIIHSGRLIDEILIELDTLTSELSERNSRIERLEESLADRRRRVVQDIKLELNIKDPHLSLKIADTIRGLLHDLIGKELDSLVPRLIRSIIHNRIVYISGQPYVLKLQYLVLAETITAEISVTSESVVEE